MRDINTDRNQPNPNNLAGAVISLGIYSVLSVLLERDPRNLHEYARVTSGTSGS